MHNKISMDDFILVYLIVEKGSLSGAAKHLNINHSTVFRRLEAVEQRLGVNLFVREDHHYIPTLAGQEIARTGALIQQNAWQAITKIEGRDLQPKGEVHITTTDSFAYSMVLPLMKECKRLYPQIMMRLSITSEIFNLSKRDADIAVRATLKPPDHLLGKKLSILNFAVYASESYWQNHSQKSWEDQEWIALDDSMRGNLTLKWLSKRVQVEHVSLRVNHFNAAKNMCQEGLGLTLLPCFLGDRVQGLTRVTAPLEECQNELWLLMHRDLKDTVRVKAIFQEFYSRLSLQKDALIGIDPIVNEG